MNIEKEIRLLEDLEWELEIIKGSLTSNYQDILDAYDKFTKQKIKVEKMQKKEEKK